MGRLIDADALCKKIKEEYDGYMLDIGYCCPADFENMVDDMPTVYDLEKMEVFGTEIEMVRKKVQHDY